MQNGTNSFFSQWPWLSFLKTSNRIGRLEHFLQTFFWSFLLGLTFIIAIKTFLFASHIIVFISLILFMLISTLCGLKIVLLHISRLHDFNVSGWWLLLMLVPLLGKIWLIAIYFIPGTSGENRFGHRDEIPKATINIKA